jgi:hypothetical protein
MVWTPIKETPYRCENPRCNKVTVLPKSYPSIECGYCGDIAYIADRPRTTGYRLTDTIEAGQDFVAFGSTDTTDHRIPCSFDLPQCEEL